MVDEAGMTKLRVRAESRRSGFSGSSKLLGIRVGVNFLLSDDDEIRMVGRTYMDVASRYLGESGQTSADS
jgi:hypothetical protein